jgi:hypothetical protein
VHQGSYSSPGSSHLGPDLLREAADAIERIGDSSRSTSDLGNDPAAPPVIEVLELWGGNLMNVGHFDARASTVLLGDPSFGRLRPWSTALTVALIFGVGVLMARHATLPDPPRFLDDDEALIAGWTSEIELDRQARARAAADQRRFEQQLREAEAEELGVSVDELPGEVEEPEPVDPLAARRVAWDAARQAEFDALKERFPEEPWRWTGGAPFEVGFLLDHERFLREEVVPLAREQAEQGRLRRGWVEIFESFDPEYPLEETEAEALEARLFAWGSQVIHDGDVWVVVPAPGDGVVHLADGSGELVEVDPETILTDRLPSLEERASRRGLHDDLQRLLYTDATRRRAVAQGCRAVSRLVVLAGAEADFELQARQASCLHDRQLRDEARPYLERALELLPARPADEAEADLVASVLQVKAEQATIAAEQDEALRGAATVAWSDLRAFVIDEVQEPGRLALADHGIHQLGLAELGSRQERLAGRAIQLALVIGLLLPVGLLVDERRSRRGAPDFAVPGWDLPEDPFPLVVVQEGLARVSFARDSVGAVLQVDGSPRTTADLVDAIGTEDMGGRLSAPLGDDQRFMLQVGQRVFSVRRVDAARAVTAPVIDQVDWRFMGTLAAVLLLGASLAVVSALLPPGATTEIVVQPDHGTVSLIAPVMIDDLPEMSGSDEGAKASGEEGRSGDPDAALDVPAARLAVRKSDRDQELVDDLINDFFADDGYVELATEGLGDTILGTLNDLVVGPRGDHRGPGDGRGVRGPGDGGGGDSRLSGVGIDGAGTGGPGRGGRDGITTIRKPKPKGPVNVGEAIFLSGIDKSAVDRVIKGHLSSLRYCYQRELPANPDLHGKVVIKFVIAKDGSVSQSSVRSSTLDNQPTERCLVEKFGRMRFVKPKGGGIAIVSYPLVFSSTGS